MDELDELESQLTKEEAFNMFLVGVITCLVVVGLFGVMFF